MTSAVILGLTSLLSLDSKSRRWISGIENDHQRQLAQGLAVHPASFCQMAVLYEKLFKRTLISQFSTADLGVLDCLPFNEDVKIDILMKIIYYRNVLSKMLN